MSHHLHGWHQTTRPATVLSGLSQQKIAWRMEKMIKYVLKYLRASVHSCTKCTIWYNFDTSLHWAVQLVASLVLSIKNVLLIAFSLFLLLGNWNTKYLTTDTSLGQVWNIAALRSSRSTNHAKKAENSIRKSRWATVPAMDVMGMSASWWDTNRT